MVEAVIENVRGENLLDRAEGVRDLRGYGERSFQQEIDSLLTWGFQPFADPIGRIPPTGFNISPQLSALNFVYASERQKEVKSQGHLMYSRVFSFMAHAYY